eukprot:scaffold3946_cov118-Isochrysis_galbana.AAC.5
MQHAHSATFTRAPFSPVLRGLPSQLSLTRAPGRRSPPLRPSAPPTPQPPRDAGARPASPVRRRGAASGTGLTGGAARRAVAPRARRGRIWSRAPAALRDPTEGGGSNTRRGERES